MCVISDNNFFVSGKKMENHSNPHHNHFPENYSDNIPHRQYHHTENYSDNITHHSENYSNYIDNITHHHSEKYSNNISHHTENYSDNITHHHSENYSDNIPLPSHRHHQYHQTHINKSCTRGPDHCMLTCDSYLVACSHYPTLNTGYSDYLKDMYGSNSSRGNNTSNTRRVKKVVNTTERTLLYVDNNSFVSPSTLKINKDSEKVTTMDGLLSLSLPSSSSPSAK